VERESDNGGKRERKSERGEEKVTDCEKERSIKKDMN
jgi:hypothetical protein